MKLDDLLPGDHDGFDSDAYVSWQQVFDCDEATQQVIVSLQFGLTYRHPLAGYPVAKECTWIGGTMYDKAPQFMGTRIEDRELIVPANSPTLERSILLSYEKERGPESILSQWCVGYTWKAYRGEVEARGGRAFLLGQAARATASILDWLWDVSEGNV